MGGSFKYLQNAEPDGKNDKKRLLNGEKTSPFGVMMLFWARDYEYSNERSIVFLIRLQYLLCRWGSFPSGRWRDVEGISRPWTSQSERGCCGNTKLMQTTLQASFDTAHGFKSASHFHTGRLRHAEPVCRLRTLFPVSCFLKKATSFDREEKTDTGNYPVWKEFKDTEAELVFLKTPHMRWKTWTSSTVHVVGGFKSYSSPFVCLWERGRMCVREVTSSAGMWFVSVQRSQHPLAGVSD